MKNAYPRCIPPLMAAGMTESTLAERREEMKARQAKAAVEQEHEWRVLDMLPDDLPTAPTICVLSAGLRANQRPGAWLGFSRRYGETWESPDIFAALERAGWVALPATLVRWDNYRRCVEPGAQESIPEAVPTKRGQHKMTDSQPIAPVWVKLNQHTGPEAFAFYEAPNGEWFKVRVPGPARCSISGQRVDHFGGWSYKRGSARLHFPDAWHSIEINGVLVAAVAKHSGAFQTLPNSIDGAIYFDAFFEQENDPRIPTPSAFLRRLAQGADE